MPLPGQGRTSTVCLLTGKGKSMIIFVISISTDIDMVRYLLVFLDESAKF